MNGSNAEDTNKPDVMELLQLYRIGEVFVYTDDDGTEYVWSVTKAKEIVEERPREITRFNPLEYGYTAEHIRSEYPGFEREHAVGADLSKPVIFLLFSGAHLFLDGWHRLYHAVSEGVESLPCYVLTEEEAQEVLALWTPKGSIET